MDRQEISPYRPHYSISLVSYWFFSSVSLSVYEDTGLLIAGLVGTSMILIRNNKRIKKHILMYDETATHLSNIQV